jgi:hypothetical protein
MNDLAQVCHELRQMADSMPPGPRRDQMHVDLRCLRVRLMALPARVAAHAPFETADEAREVLERELAGAFADLRKWGLEL